MGFCNAEAFAFRCTARKEEIRKTLGSTLGSDLRLVCSFGWFAPSGCNAGTKGRKIGRVVHRGRHPDSSCIPPSHPRYPSPLRQPLLRLSSACLGLASQFCFDILVPPATDNRPSFRPNEFCTETRNLESYFHIWNLIFSRNMCILKNKCQKNRKSHEPTGEFDWILSHRRIGGERGFILLMGASHGRRSR